MLREPTPTPRELRADRRMGKIASKSLRVVFPRSRRCWAQVFFGREFVSQHRVVPVRSGRLGKVLIVTGDMEGCVATVLSVEEHTKMASPENPSPGSVTLITVEYTTGLGYTKSANFDSIGVHPVAECMHVLSGIGPNPPRPPRS